MPILKTNNFPICSIGYLDDYYCWLRIKQSASVGSDSCLFAELDQNGLIPQQTQVLPYEHNKTFKTAVVIGAVAGLQHFTGKYTTEHLKEITANASAFSNNTQFVNNIATELGSVLNYICYLVDKSVSTIPG